MGFERAVRVPYQFLGGQPSRPLDKSALHLADVERGVQRCARVVQDVRAQHAVFAGERVEHHLGQGNPVGEIEERASVALDPVPLDFRGLVKSRGREADAVLIGEGNHLREGHIIRAKHHPVVAPLKSGFTEVVAQERFQTGAQGVTGGFDRHAVEVRAA